CFGAAGSFVQPCFSVPPVGTFVLSGTIDTGGAMCSTTVTNTTACVIAGATIQVASGVTVTVTGPRPLVAVSDISIAGTLDVASHHAAAAPYATVQRGASADAAVCDPGAPGGAGGG